MCGLGGILRSDGATVPDEWLDVIDARLAHRGPDGCGRFRDRATVRTDEGHERTVEVALVHRRLAVIDPAGGTQPMIVGCDRDDEAGSRLAVVFNGCIYNHRELRRELEAAGRTFATDHSDTEVLLHAYRAWGPGFEQRLEGMYAFALWDHAAARLVLGRDRFGEKPLYVRWGVGGDPGALAFASDSAALADLGGVWDDEVDDDDLRRWTQTYLQLGYNWKGRTIYTRPSDHKPRGVYNLPPSIVQHADEWITDRPRIETSPAEFEAIIEQAVRQRLEADVPLGCFLSGGVDSSLIAHFARNHKPDLRTFTVRMPDDRYDESAHAEAVATHLGTDHQTLDVAVQPADDLVHLIETLGQPFGDSSILPTYWVSRAARQHVTVCLSGDGGDELFLGYRRYMAARHLHRHRRALRWIPRAWADRGHPTSRRHLLGRLGSMARDYPRLGVLGMESIFTQAQIRALTGERPEAPATHDPGRDPLLALRRIDLMSYLPDDLLCKVDTASMAVALEVRAPFLDSRLVQAALNAPTWLLAPNGRRKGLLRDIARRHLPDAIVDRPKMGFAVPIGEWFRNDYGSMRTLLEDHLRAADPFDPVPVDRDAVLALLDEHLAGRRDHSQRLFALLTLSIWSRWRRSRRANGRARAQEARGLNPWASGDLQ